MTHAARTECSRRVRGAIHVLLELTNSAPELAAEVAELSGAEEYERDPEDEQEVGRLEQSFEHVSIFAWRSGRRQIRLSGEPISLHGEEEAIVASAVSALESTMTQPSSVG